MDDQIIGGPLSWQLILATSANQLQATPSEFISEISSYSSLRTMLSVKEASDRDYLWALAHYSDRRGRVERMEQFTKGIDQLSPSEVNVSRERLRAMLWSLARKRGRRRARAQRDMLESVNFLSDCVQFELLHRTEGLTVSSSTR